MGSFHRRKLKVRTGCITCKIRKVKCDEGRPACKRCTDTGRKCDGYLGRGESEGNNKLSLISATQENNLPSTLGSPCTDVDCLSDALTIEERGWLKYFGFNAGPMFSGLADTAFWSSVLLQLSSSEQAIRHAVLAISAFHATLRNDASSEKASIGIGYCYSVKHYNLAIASLQQDLSGHCAKVEVPLICCLLFICLECLYGERGVVLNHLRNGLNILSSQRFLDSRSTFVMSIKPSLQQAFRRLDAQSTLFGRPASRRFGHPTVETISVVPASFIDIHDAQRSLDDLIHVALNFVRFHNDRALAGIPYTQANLLTLGRLRAQFGIWSEGIDQHLTKASYVDTSDMELISRLRIQHRASYIYLCNCLDVFETSYDAFQDDFAAIVRLSCTIIEASNNFPDTGDHETRISQSVSSSPASTFALDAVLIPSLFLAAVKCRDPVIRRDAILLLERYRGREGLWDAKLHGRVARRIVEIEESAMLISQGAAKASMESEPSMKMQADGVVLTGLPDERFRVQSADIHRDPRDTCRSARVVFYTAPEGITEQWSIWEEEVHF